MRFLPGVFIGGLLWCVLIWCCGCSLSKGLNPTPNRYYDIHVANCKEGFQEAQSYLLSHGIVLYHSEQAKQFLVCLTVPSWIFRQLSPINFVGYSDGKVAWTFDDAKLILHELGHLLWALPHSVKGIMSPIDSPLATGFTDEQLKVIRGN